MGLALAASGLRGKTGGLAIGSWELGIGNGRGSWEVEGVGTTVDYLLQYDDILHDRMQVHLHPAI